MLAESGYALEEHRGLLDSPEREESSGRKRIAGKRVW